MVCRDCGREHGSDVRFCTECGKELTNEDQSASRIAEVIEKKKRCCPKCGKEIAGDTKFCIECGQKFTAEESRKPSLNPKGNRVVEAVGSLKEVVDKTRENPKILLILLGLNFLICAISFSSVMEMPKALIASFAFTVLWGLIFVLVPALLRILLGILAMVAVVAIFIAILKATNDNIIYALIGTAVIIFAICAIIGLIMYAAFLLPGLILGVGAYKIFGEGTGGFIAGVILFAVVSGILYFILRYIVPFIIGFSWAFFTGILSYRITAGVIGGLTVAGDMSDSYNRGLTSASVMHSAGTLLKYVFSSIKPPTLLALWIILISIALGILIAKGAGEEG
jgi:hypothetical protein